MAVTLSARSLGGAIAPFAPPASLALTCCKASTASLSTPDVRSINASISTSETAVFSEDEGGAIDLDAIKSEKSIIDGGSDVGDVTSSAPPRPAARGQATE